MKVSISTIKDWFKSGSRPTQSQFWSTWDSFWHKDEQIPVTSIEDLQENLDSKLDVELYENNNAQSASFKNVGDGTPNVDTTEAAYREGKIGVGEPNPIETVDVVGSGKFQYTYGDNSVARSTLGGENTNSEIGLPGGLIKTNTLAFFPDPSVHPSTQGYFYTGDVSTIAPTSGKLSTGVGIASLTNTKYARTTYFPSNSNGKPESEFAGVFAARHEDGNSASIQVSSKGGDVGNNQEAYLSLTSSNEATFGRIALTPRIASIQGALLQLKEYGNDTISQGYVHNDTIENTGTEATVIGALKPLGADSAGNIGKIVSYKETVSEFPDLESEDEFATVSLNNVFIGDPDSQGNGTKFELSDGNKNIDLIAGTATLTVGDAKVEAVIGDTHVKVETTLGTFAEMVSGNAQLNVSSGVAFMGGDRIYIRPNSESPLPTTAGQFLKVIDNQGQVAWADAPGSLKSYKESGQDEDELIVEIGDLSTISNGTKIIIDNDEEIITLKTSNAIFLSARHITAFDLPIQNINNPKSLTTKEYVDSKVSILPKEYYAELTFDGAGKITINEIKNTFEDASNNVNIGTSSYFTEGTGKDASYILNFINESGTGGTSEVITKGANSGVPDRIIKFFQYSEGAVFDDGLSDTLVTVYNQGGESFVRIRVLDIKNSSVLSTTSQLNGKLIMHVKEV